MIASKKRDETLDFFQKSVMHIYEDIVTTRSVSVWGLLVNSGGFQTMRESKALEQLEKCFYSILVLSYRRAFHFVHGWIQVIQIICDVLSFSWLCNCPKILSSLTMCRSLQSRVQTSNAVANVFLISWFNSSTIPIQYQRFCVLGITSGSCIML